VTEIMVNGAGRIFVERAGRLELAEGVCIREQNLRVAVRNLARVLGDDVSEEQPLLDSRPPDGSRVAAALPPVGLGGTTLTIRKVQSRFFTVDELVRIGTLTAGELTLIRQPIDARPNILISGGIGTGKTTLLKVLTAFLPIDDRLVLIEAPPSSSFRRPTWCASKPAVSGLACRSSPFASCCAPPCAIAPIASSLARSRRGSLRRVAGPQHRSPGTLSTIHANSDDQALRRFTSCVLQSGVDLPYAAIRHGIADCVQVLVHLERRHTRRVVSELVRVRGYDPSADRTTCNRCPARPHRPRLCDLAASKRLPLSDIRMLLPFSNQPP
jgi:pilus assembly protein CpaF